MIQTEEAIVFDVDHEKNQVTATINIVYQGAAPDFAWLLPLQVAPSRVDVGSRALFTSLQAATRPRFIARYEDSATCDDELVILADNEQDPIAAGTGERGVEVLEEKTVGPYQTATLEGDPEAIESWLKSRDYVVTPGMMAAVRPYLAQGDVLLALRLTNDATAGEIQPLEVEMRAPPSERALDACVPIRLTAIAADADMPVLAYVLSDAGRAIPENYHHVTPNWLRIDWLNGGLNYRALLSEAVNMAPEGHAFTTEYAGPPDAAAQLLALPEGLEALSAIEDLGELLDRMRTLGVLLRPGVRAVLETHFPALLECRGCAPSDFLGWPVTGDAWWQDLEARVFAPDRRALAALEKRHYLTRLLTLLDPEEMTEDPIFHYRADLPPVSNIHEARVIRHCGSDGRRDRADIEIVLEDGRRIYYRSGQGPSDTPIAATPAAAQIQQLFEDRVAADHQSDIDEALARHNAAAARAGFGASGRSGIFCSGGPFHSGGTGPLWGLLLGAMAVLARGRTRRS